VLLASRDLLAFESKRACQGVNLCMGLPSNSHIVSLKKWAEFSLVACKNLTIIF
jgi:hypothetical protein